MEKKLITVGNSVALVIDKSLRLSLGIKPTTLVRVMTDGRRIIIEPSGERTPETKRGLEVSERMTASAVARHLLESFNMTNELMAELTCGWVTRKPCWSMNRYRSWLEAVDWDQLTHAERRVMRRFHIAYSVKQQNGGWRDAIAAALADQPFDPNDPAERSVGARKDESVTHCASSASPAQLQSCELSGR